ncbi:MAG: crotonase [Firmicutes bacterium]|nr:crotonase [Bacillota bacterium]
MDLKNIILEKEEGIAKITFNRPEALNALNDPARAEFRRAMADVIADEEIKVIILTGSGRAFIAGSDIKELKETTPLNAHKILRLGEIIENCPKPVIAAVNGLALGGGCEIAMACDLIIASEKAKLGQPEINLGIIPGGGATQRLPHLVGLLKAKELILTGDIIDAVEAERIGLVNRVVPAGELEEAVEILAKKIARKSTAALQIAKAAINRGLRTGLDSGLAYEREMYSLSLSTEDKVEGVEAFIEKRRPTFKGC